MLLLRLLLFATLLAFAFKTEAITLHAQLTGNLRASIRLLQWSQQADNVYHGLCNILVQVVLRRGCPIFYTAVESMRRYLDDEFLAACAHRRLPETIAALLSEVLADTVHLLDRAHDIGQILCMFAQHLHNLNTLLQPYYWIFQPYLPFRIQGVVNLVWAIVSTLVISRAVAIVLSVVLIVVKWTCRVVGIVPWLSGLVQG